jgi:phosphoglycerate dehydrogenase-like enzyme
MVWAMVPAAPPAERKSRATSCPAPTSAKGPYGRFGVGVDTVDVGACTAADVLVFIAAAAVDRSVAEAALARMLALAYRVRPKDALVRAGRWDERSAFMGSELRDRTLGVIGRALIRLTAGFGMRRPLASDPHVDPALASELGAMLVSLDDLLREADFVSIHCPLDAGTRNMIGRRELGLMKPEAYLINTARGGIVDEEALHEALTGRRIAGAAVDVFDGEPLTGPHRFADLENVLLAPHSIAWTHELFRDIGRTVSRGMLDLSRGERPRGAVNPEVFEQEGFRRKQARLTGS